MPRTRLILTQKGSAFELSVKRRINFDGETVEYLAADSLQSYATGLCRSAGLGAVIAAIVAAEPLQVALSGKGICWTPFSYRQGHSHLDHVAPYLDVTVCTQRDALSAFDQLEWGRRKRFDEPISVKTARRFQCS